MQKINENCRKLAAKLNCMSTPWEPPVVSSPLHSSPLPTASASRSAATSGSPQGASGSMTGGTSARTLDPRGNGGLGPYDDDNDDDDDEDAATDEYRLQHHGLHSDEYHDLPAHGWDPWEPQEIGLSQLTGAPVGTQTNSQVTVLSLCKYCIIRTTCS